MALTVERRRDLPYQTFVEEYLEAGRPVVLLDAAKDWPALRWTPDFFRNNFPTVEVIGRAGNAASGPARAGTRAEMAARRKYSMRDFVDAVEASTPDDLGPYAVAFCLRSVPALLADISPVHQYMRGNWLESRLLPPYTIDMLFGPTGACLPYFHRDRLHAHTFTTMTHGCKLFVLYSPDQTPLMYPREGTMIDRFRSSIDDPERPDLDRFPRFAEAVPTLCELRPGETLFLPGGWWHYTRILSTAINIRHCYLDGTNCAGAIEELREALRETGWWSSFGGAPVAPHYYPNGLLLAGLRAVQSLRARKRPAKESRGETEDSPRLRP